MSGLRTLILAVALVVTMCASYSLMVRAPAPQDALPAPSRQPSGAAVRGDASGSRGDEEAAADRTTAATLVRGWWKYFAPPFPVCRG